MKLGLSLEQGIQRLASRVQRTAAKPVHSCCHRHIACWAGLVLHGVVDNQSFHRSSDHRECSHMQAGSVGLVAAFSVAPAAASVL
ncbi:MAG: hypothetical protein AAES65_10245 [Candidatus Thiodiazotropha sp. (ex. Lucinoma kazani)]